MNRIVVGPRHDVVADRLAGGPGGRWAAIESESLVTVIDTGGAIELPELVGARFGEVGFSPDGSELLAAPHRFSFDRNEWVIDPLGVRSGRPASGPSGQRSLAACWSPDGESLAMVDQVAGRREQTIHWRRPGVAETMVGVDHWSGKQQIEIADLDGPVVVVGSTFVEVWDPTTRSLRWQGEPGRWQITRLICAAGLVVTGDAGGSLAAVGLADGAPHWALDVGAEITGLATLTATSSGPSCAVSTVGGEVLLVDLHGEQLAHLQLDDPVADLAASAPDRLVAAAAPPATGVTELIVRD